MGRKSHIKRFISSKLFAVIFAVFVTASFLSSNAFAALTSDALLNAFKSYVTTPSQSNTSGSGSNSSTPLVSSPVVTTTNTISDTQLLSAMRRLISDPSIQNQLRGPQGVQGIQGPAGSSGGGGGSSIDTSRFVTQRQFDSQVDGTNRSITNLSQALRRQVNTGTLDVSGDGTFGNILPKTSRVVTDNIITTGITSDVYSNFYMDSDRWSFTGNDGFIRTAYFAEDQSVISFVRCLDNDCGTKNITVINPDETGDSDFVTIAKGPDGFARILYNLDYVDIHFVVCADADCNPNTPGFSDTAIVTGASLYEQAFALASDGTARIAYVDYNDSAKVKFIECINSSCSSNTSTTLSGTNSSYFVNIVLDSNNIPSIIYDSGGDINFARCSDASCSSTSTSTIANDGYYYISSTLGQDGFIRFAFNNTDGLFYVVCNDANCSSPTVTLVNIDAATKQFSMVLGEDGFGRIVSEGNEKYYQCLNDSCSSKNTSTIASSGYPTSLALGNDGLARVIWTEDRSTLKMTRLLTNSGEDTTTFGSSIGSEEHPFDNVYANSYFNANGEEFGQWLKINDDLAYDGGQIRHTGGMLTLAAAVHPLDDGDYDGLYVYGKYLYGNDVINGYMTTYDISNPTNPELVSTLEIPGANGGFYKGALAVSGNYAYVGNETASGLTIVDISNPSDPTIVGSLSTVKPNGIKIVGRYLYEIDAADQKLAIVDISDPTNPTLVARTAVLDAGGSTQLYGLDVSGKYAYAANGLGTSAFYIIDISDPTNPIVVSTTATEGQNGAGYVHLRGKYLYVAMLDEGDVYDVSDPTDPILVGTWDGTSGNFTIAGNYIYSGNNGSGVKIFDISDPISPTLVADYDGTVAGAARGSIQLVGNYLYMDDFVGGFKIFNVSGVSTPTLSTGSVNSDRFYLGDGDINGSLSINGGLNIGTGGILSNGPVAISQVASSDRALLTLSPYENTDVGIQIIGVQDGDQIEFINRDSSNKTWSYYMSGNNLRMYEWDTDVAGGTGNDRFFFNAGGMFGIGVNPSVALDVNGDIEYTGTITDVSDRRLKENIKDFGSGLDILNNIEVKNFNMIQTPNKTETGFIAQNVQQFFPEAVSVIDPEHGYLGVSYVSFIPVLTKAVQELDLNLNGIAGVVTPLPGSDNESFVTSFFSNLFTKVTTWLADASNGIADLFADTIHAGTIYVNKICTDDVCIDKEQLKALLLDAGGASSTQDESSSESESNNTSSNSENTGNTSGEQSVTEDTTNSTTGDSITDTGSETTETTGTEGETSTTLQENTETPPDSTSDSSNTETSDEEAASDNSSSGETTTSDETNSTDASDSTPSSEESAPATQ